LERFVDLQKKNSYQKVDNQKRKTDRSSLNLKNEQKMEESRRISQYSGGAVINKIVIISDIEDDDKEEDVDDKKSET
jgi:hypothetical protein